MKKVFYTILLATSIGSFTLISCKKDQPLSSEKNEQLTTNEGEKVLADTALSKIEWTGYKIFRDENSSHFGTIPLKEGVLTIKDGKLESGTFTADMKSLEVGDLADKPDRQNKLINHLKSDDFFGVEKYPVATYTITKISETTEGSDFNTLLDGNLTIKGISKPTQVKANVVINDQEVTISTEPTDVNRKEFGVKFDSPLADEIVKDEITLQIQVKAKR